MSEKIIGPFTVELKVHITDADGSVTGAATVGLGAGTTPTLEAIHRAIGQTLAACPDGMRLQNGEEFFDSLVKEKTGRRVKLATPSSFQYDVAALESAARAAYVKEPQSDDDDLDEEEDEDFEE